MGNEKDRLADQSAFYPNGYVPSSLSAIRFPPNRTLPAPTQDLFPPSATGFAELTKNPDMTKVSGCLTAIRANYIQNQYASKASRRK